MKAVGWWERDQRDAYRQKNSRRHPTHGCSQDHSNRFCLEEFRGHSTDAESSLRSASPTPHPGPRIAIARQWPVIAAGSPFGAHYPCSALHSADRCLFDVSRVAMTGPSCANYPFGYEMPNAVSEMVQIWREGCRILKTRARGATPEPGTARRDPFSTCRSVSIQGSNGPGNLPHHPPV